MDLGLSGRVAIITGPAKGMGRAVSLAFASEGCRLALLGRDIEAIAPVRDIVTGNGGSAEVIACDITDEGACTDAVAQVTSLFGGQVDILVNVAGGSGPMGKTGAETSAAEFRDIVDVNMTGCFNTMRAVAPVMMAQRAGKIVNVGGTFGMRGRAGRVAYSASKWGLRGIVKSFALELGPYNINVNTVAPGMVDGSRFRDKVCRTMALRLNISEEEAARRHAEDYALKRVSTDTDVGQCLPVPRERRVAADHRRGPAGGRRLGGAVGRWPGGD